MKSFKKYFLLLGCVILNAMAATDVIHINKEHLTFTIDLPANATTGYSWVLGKHDPLIQLMSATYYPRRNTQLIGAPGHTVFLFKVPSNAFSIKSTKRAVVLELLYERRWDKEIGLKRSYQIVIDSSSY